MRATHKTAQQRHGRIAMLVALLFSLAATPGFAQRDDSSDDAPRPERPVTLPAPPQDADLLVFNRDAGGGFSDALDARSLSPDLAEGVVRYTLVSISRSGARNISYEGLRCSSNEFRVYAYGRPDGSWNQVNGPWRGIRASEGFEAQNTLAQGLLCKDRIMRRSAGAMLQQLRHPEGKNY